MCAIIDSNVANEVFGSNRPEAGEKFLQWLNTGKGRLVVGGQLRNELYQYDWFRKWAKEAALAGRVKVVNEEKVRATTILIASTGKCRSNDPHIIALAQISRARLLYSNDIALGRDFKNKELVDGPRGTVYTTNGSPLFTRARRQSLNKPDLCQSTSIPGGAS